jgi:hypothetical protein
MLACPTVNEETSVPEALTRWARKRRPDGECPQRDQRHRGHLLDLMRGG